MTPTRRPSENTSHQKATLAHIPHFAGLPSAVQDAIAEEALPRYFKAGQVHAGRVPTRTAQHAAGSAPLISTGLLIYLLLPGTRKMLQESTTE